MIKTMVQVCIIWKLNDKKGAQIFSVLYEVQINPSTLMAKGY